MKLGIPVYEGVNLLDVTGPLEMFSWVDKKKGLETRILSADGGPVTSLNGIRFDAQASFAATPKLDVLWVPGGAPDALGGIMSDPASPYLAYLRQVAIDAKWVCSVCEGALLLARAGLLDGHRVTTHWAFVDCLRRFPAVKVARGHPRFVESGNRLTGGGISSGLDEALHLIARLFNDKTAVEVQVTTQYFPVPPVSGKIPSKAPECMIQW
ncbi:MAG TPA: DJ-1/PfpI family protein [Mesorhizobium sp.]|jgi:cyclohexyl-isocyanide hydratase|uniref:DJ-1/PfpI family protein n=1 Tax=Mesorhizobium sp. TaxID=1871066 RepID=UPI002DDD8296|nr:DJ-1/PfpI family protein [Mesorhizobium sp.]HEV2507909.1 DJ-1/PfpI family protein [Mesorhizobium sp.]